MGRYGAEIARYNGELEYNAAIRFDNGYDCAVTISQSVVQDVFHFIQDVRDIREHRVECEFLRIKPGSCDARAPQFTVLVWHRLNVRTPTPHRSLTIWPPSNSVTDEKVRDDVDGSPDEKCQHLPRLRGIA